MVSTTIKRALGMGAIALSLTGCVVNKELVPTGGSRSDGTVVLSYTYGLFEQPKIDAVQGQQSAAQRCRACRNCDAHLTQAACASANAVRGWLHTETRRRPQTCVYRCLAAR